MRVAPAIALTEEQMAELTRLARSKRTSVRLAERAQIVLLAAQGLTNKDIAEQLGVGRVQAARWRQRYLEIRQPWTQAGDGDQGGLGTTLYAAAESLRVAAALLFPMMPATGPLSPRMESLRPRAVATSEPPTRSRWTRRASCSCPTSSTTASSMRATGS